MLIDCGSRQHYRVADRLGRSIEIVSNTIDSSANSLSHSIQYSRYKSIEARKELSRSIDSAKRALIQSSTIVAEARRYAADQEVVASRHMSYQRRIEYERPQQLMITVGKRKLRKRNAMAITSNIVDIGSSCTVMSSRRCL